MGIGQGAKKKKNSSCIKVSPPGLAMVPGSSVQSPASDYSIKNSTAAKGWGDGEGENCLDRRFPWNAKKNEMEPVEFSTAYEELAQMSIAGYTL